MKPVANKANRNLSQLSVILDSFATLAQLDTTDVPPTAHTLPLVNIERTDEPAASYPTDVILNNAPRQENHFIRVKRVLE